MADITNNNVYHNEERLVDYLDDVETLIEELHDDAATNRSLLVELAHDRNNRWISVAPVFAIDTNFDVKNTEVAKFCAAGITYSLTDNTSCDTGTTKTITATKWAAFVIDATNATTLTATWTGGNATLSAYNSEALALAAALDIALVTDQCRLGIVTVQAGAATWTAGTDALATGAGGTAANATNYYGADANLMHKYASPAATLTAGKPSNDIVPTGGA